MIEKAVGKFTICGTQSEVEEMTDILKHENIYHSNFNQYFIKIVTCLGIFIMPIKSHFKEWQGHSDWYEACSQYTGISEAMLRQTYRR